MADVTLRGRKSNHFCKSQSLLEGVWRIADLDEVLLLCMLVQFTVIRSLDATKLLLLLGLPVFVLL